MTTLKTQCKMKREFTKRKFQKRLEVKPTARIKINKKKYNGVKKNISEYKKYIFEHFSNVKLFDKILKGAEDLQTKFNQYIFMISSDYSNLLLKANELIGDSFRKGTKRTLDNKGNTIKLDEPIDETAIDILVNQQTTYYDNLTANQSRNVNKIIAKGLEEGKPNDIIADEIKKEIKDISNIRALRIARAEIIKSHSIAQIDTMRQAGIEEYNYITANDKKVSKICRHNQGAKGREKIYKTSLAGTKDNPLPVLNSHPNCRCVTVAHIK